MPDVECIDSGNGRKPYEFGFEGTWATHCMPSDVPLAYNPCWSLPVIVCLSLGTVFFAAHVTALMRVINAEHSRISSGNRSFEVVSLLE